MRRSHASERAAGPLLVLRPHTLTVAARAYVRAGSRYDAEHPLPEEASPALGLAHLTEHLLFKGTHHRTQRQLGAAIEGLGGTLEAGTAKEYLHISAVMPSGGLAAALQAISLVLVEPALREDDFWNEKLVLLRRSGTPRTTRSASSTCLPRHCGTRTHFGILCWAPCPASRPWIMRACSPSTGSVS